MDAKQTPLIELLERVPQDARVVVEHDQFSSTSHPVGRLCHEAAAALRAALAEPECKCTMRQKMVGDGCAVCNPERAKDLAEPQTTHWEGCEAVHPECRKPEQEPVAWQWLDTANYRKKLPANAILEHWRPLFTAPTPRKPLTNEEISAIFDDTLEGGSFFDVALAVARAIERAHGITGEGA